MLINLEKEVDLIKFRTSSSPLKSPNLNDLTVISFLSTGYEYVALGRQGPWQKKCS
jgi:hypothetical protein